MSGRSYLSIGDVLTLLRQEFPDVTISKIRFLESQGLVNPERTPSGYRKFYDHDVERLRWVLRQQREHFLPLKVIKDRLEDDASAEGTSGSDPGPAEALNEAAAHPEVPADEYRGQPAEERVLVGQRVAADAVVGERAGPGAEPQRPVTKVGGGTTLPGIESTAGSSAGASPVGAPDRSATGAGPTRAAPVSRTVEPARTALPSRAEDGVPAEPAVAGGGSATADHGGSGRPSRSAPSTSAAPPARQRRPRSASGATPPTREGNGTAGSASGQAGGTNMSIEELAAASGLGPEMLLELQGFGILTPTLIAGLEYYDEESLAVATAVARFAQFGIEPRHLSLYKNAAAREAGFIEQIVLPLLRQRNPEARARARETVDELSDLGLQLRGALLRIALRGMLGD
jgi:DNA-binding transcriptional MerR regulator